MVRKCLFFVAVLAVAGLALGGCGGNGPSEPMQPDPMDMPMQVTAADSLGR